jgi:hypothetical protein
MAGGELGLALGVAAFADGAHLEIGQLQVAAGGAFDRAQHGIDRAIADRRFAGFAAVVVAQLH